MALVAAFDEQHNITGRAAAAARAAAAKASELNAKYDITSKVKASASNAVASARELEQKHQITSKVGSALGRGLDKLSAVLDPATRGAPPAAVAPPAPSQLPSVPR